MEWTLTDAKNRFSGLFNLTLSNGAQHVRRRQQSVVVLPEAEYERLTGTRPRFKDHLLSAPDLGSVDLGRDVSLMREVTL